MDKKLIKAIEKHGYTNPNGHRIYGTAVLLHYLRLANCPVSGINPCMIETGRIFVQNYLRI